MQKIHKILIGIAFSPNLKPNLFEAIRIANMFNAELIGVHVGEKTDQKITDLNEENKKIIFSHPPDIIFVYSARSAVSFIEIVKKYSLYPLMTGSKVMCISKKVADIFTNNNWKKIEIFNPGDELLQLGEKN